MTTLEYFNEDKLAAEVYEQKYQHKIGDRAETPQETISRLVKELVDNENQYVFDLKNISGNSYNELSEHGKHEVNTRMSSIMSNEYDEYLNKKIHSYLDGLDKLLLGGSIISTLGTNQKLSLSNCFVINSPTDSLSGINSSINEMDNIFSRRGGVGLDLSTLRPAGSIINNAARISSGVVPVMKYKFAESTKYIAQNGRRGALMLMLSSKHPDVSDFISAKQDDVSITTANISVKMHDDFMQAAANDEDYLLRYPVDSDVSKYESIKEDFEYDKLYEFDDICIKKVKAKNIWDKLVKCAWAKAEPGILFWDRILNYDPSSIYEKLKPIATNPCFVGSTLVAVAEGRAAITIKELAESDEYFTVFSAKQPKSAGNPVEFVTEIKKAKAFKTGVKPVIKIVLSDGSSFKCTQDHMLALPNGTYIEAKNSIGKELVKFRYHMENTSADTHIYVSDIIDENEIEDVYDLTVEDNHNFYIITKTDDETFFNSTGVLVHNCGEQPLAAYDTCRLLSYNLSSFVHNPYTDSAYIDYDEVYKTFYDIQWLADDIVDLECKYVKRIIDKLGNSNEDNDKIIKMWNKVIDTAKNGRRTGVGFTGLGDMYAALGLDYGDELVTNAVFKTIFKAQFDSTCDLGLIRGKYIECSGFDSVKHNDWHEFVHKEFPEIYDRLGYARNVSVSTVAPTGSLSILAQCTSGIEPLFLPYYKRKVKVMTADEPFDVVDTSGERFKIYFVVHNGLKKWINIKYPEIDLNTISESKLNSLFKESPYYNNCAQDLDWHNRVRLQSQIQKYITASISSTVNLDKSISESEVNDLLLESYKSGCKGITIYRDGCRDGVLTATNSDFKDNPAQDNNAVKRPKVLECSVIRFSNNNEKWISFVGEHNDRPYEIFTGLESKLDVPKGIDKGRIIKNKLEDGARYDFQYYDKDGNQYVITGINKVFNPEFWNYGKLLSVTLRHRVPVRFVIETLQKLTFDNLTINNWRNGVIRSLKKWVKDGEESGNSCPKCKSKLIYENGCVRCPNCGYSQCG